MILLQAVVQISARPVDHFMSQYPANSAWVRVVSVSRYLLGLMTNHLLGTLEEALGRLHVPMLRKHRVDQVAIPIYGPVQVTPFPVDLNVRFIRVPGPTRFASSSWAELLGDHRREACFPIPNRFMCKLKPPLQEHLCESRRLNLYRNLHKTTSST